MGKGRSGVRFATWVTRALVLFVDSYLSVVLEEDYQVGVAVDQAVPPLAASLLDPLSDMRSRAHAGATLAGRLSDSRFGLYSRRYGHQRRFSLVHPIRSYIIRIKCN